MPQFKLNLAKSAGRRVLEDGWYKAEIDVAEFRSKGNKRGQDAVLHIEAVTKDNEHSVQNGVRLFRDQSCGAKSQWALKEIVEAAMGTFEGEQESADIDFDDLSGSQVWLQVSTDDTYDGVLRNQINRWAHIEAELDEDGYPVAQPAQLITRDGKIEDIVDEEAEEEEEEAVASR